ncbi:MAG: PASTA domain-containing protein [Chitinispirillaceae bacterium]|nr:PASTA domain-containing protein [Chitinispirillaceae bacterium]
MKRSYTISIPVGTFWKVLLPGMALLAVFGSIGGIVFVDRVVMPNVVGVNRDVVTVPDVAKLTYEEAREVFFKAGLLTEIQGREYDDTVPEQGVISQQPIAGARVKKGRKISVFVSKGKEIAIVPDVRNVTERQARIIMKKAGFTLGNVKKVFSEERPVDVVINAFPKSGTTTSREIEVDLFVSKGPRPTHAEVPNLVGESLKNAKKLIAESGLSVGAVSYQNNPSLLPGTIISQSSAPGSNVPLESKLNLVVSVIR